MYGSSVGDFILIISGLLILLVFITWVINAYVVYFRQRRQYNLLLRASCTLSLIEDVYNLIREMKDCHDKEDLLGWSSEYVAISDSVDSYLRHGLFKGDDGYPIAVYPLRHEINKKPIDCALDVSVRVTKEAGYYDLNDKEVLQWLLAVVQNLMLIKLDSMMIIHSPSDAADVLKDGNHLALFNHCFSRLKVLFDTRPVKLENVGCVEAPCVHIGQIVLCR